jgi:hypothetical protein
MVAYAAPFVMLAFVAAAVAGRNIPNSPRRLIIAAAIVIRSLGWTLFRTEGIDGDHRATFAWRWSATTEQQLLAKPIPSAPPVETAPAQPTAPAAKPKPAVLSAVRVENPRSWHVESLIRS